MTTGIWVLGDQLWAGQAALQTSSGANQTPAILIESLHHAQERPYHRQKLVLVWSAMRHFAEELRQSGFSVTYIRAADNFQTPLEDWIKANGITELRVMAPADRPFAQLIQNLQLPCQLTLVPNNHFLWSEGEFKQWAKKRKRFLMEDFYREGRRRFGILMDGEQPAGGQWNYDRENRKPPKGKLNTPSALWFEPDEITQEVIEQVKLLTAAAPSPPQPPSPTRGEGGDRPSPPQFPSPTRGEGGNRPSPPQFPSPTRGEGGDRPSPPQPPSPTRGGSGPPLGMEGRGGDGDRTEGQTDRWQIPPALREKMKEVARQFCKQPTKSEALLWEALRNRQLQARKFRRQQPIGPFVVDFFCSEERLIVEVDGPIHESQRTLDAQRQQLLESLGFRFVRLSSDLVENDLPAALDTIRQAFTPLSPLELGVGAQADITPLSPRVRGAGGEGRTYGDAEPFRWAVTRAQALQVLDHFIHHRLPAFGPYQDAMVTGEETMWHSLISPYLNIGLLHPLEVIQAAERAYRENRLDLSSTEGFIRQVMGWREYMRGVYAHTDAGYPQRNWFSHTQPLPAFFWDAEKTDMNCLRQVLSQIQRTGYAHHIQRLMVLSNFALIAGLNPQEVEQWFHAAFIDAYDWVMQTNVIGMGLFADGGVLASKPYAASANYISKMSDYCQNCVYSHKERTGTRACPFNFFYWDFLHRHRDKLASQGRMSFILANLDRMPPEELEQIRQQAADWHAAISNKQ